MPPGTLPPSVEPPADLPRGRHYLAPQRTRTIPGSLREPSVLLVSDRLMEDPREPVLGAALLMEVLRMDREHRDRDQVEKRADYAAAGIPECWNVGPDAKTIEDLTLDDGGAPAVQGRFREGDRATSRRLTSLAIDLSACFRAGESAGAAASPP